MTGSAAYIRTLHGWRTVCALVTMTSLHPDAFAIALDALAVVARPPALAPPSFPPCLEAVMAVAERNASKARPALPLAGTRNTVFGSYIATSYLTVRGLSCHFAHSCHPN